MNFLENEIAKLAKLNNQQKKLRISILAIICLLVITYMLTKRLPMYNYKNVPIDYKEFNSLLATDDYCYADVVYTLHMVDRSNISTFQDKKTGKTFDGGMTYIGSFYLALDTNDEFLLLFLPSDEKDDFEKRTASLKNPIRLYGKIGEHENASTVFSVDTIYEKTKSGQNVSDIFDEQDTLSEKVKEIFDQCKIMDVDMTEAKDYPVKTGHGIGFYCLCIELLMLIAIIILIRLKNKKLDEIRETKLSILNAKSE